MSGTTEISKISEVWLEHIGNECWKILSINVMNMGVSRDYDKKFSKNKGIRFYPSAMNRQRRILLTIFSLTFLMSCILHISNCFKNYLRKEEHFDYLFLKLTPALSSFIERMTADSQSLENSTF